MGTKSCEENGGQHMSSQQSSKGNTHGTVSLRPVLEVQNNPASLGKVHRWGVVSEHVPHREVVYNPSSTRIAQQQGTINLAAHNASFPPQTPYMEWVHVPMMNNGFAPVTPTGFHAVLQYAVNGLAPVPTTQVCLAPNSQVLPRAPYTSYILPHGQSNVMSPIVADMPRVYTVNQGISETQYQRQGQTASPSPTGKLVPYTANMLVPPPAGKWELSSIPTRACAVKRGISELQGQPQGEESTPAERPTKKCHLKPVGATR
mmetsp:Transcript_2607/g.3748  ORF Transcript_2607/g.3748 Transcript_2607/m.3748 type:complete len:260 (-) Transcript_2607:68-847(-)|eukprot:CAMPEP_0203787006 /NCGR_PEP_ID=MMETSP0100_2-20121128/1963_1 /ASSEMBLY_ACC=CAM_ASM_000210 /TAXON_ID=96639 /ORGANISM=" , Strain NY0313808BC1" /LENGTH=259 /DNA_ID=CAMNT_0050689413 /DNA_START=669 /DNA_END=1448 /DNA_ORIENTATION=-